MQTTAKSKYKRDITISFILYGLILFAVNTYLKEHGTEGVLAVVLALLPILPILYFARAVLVFSRSWDELQKQIALEATLVAVFVVGLGSFSYGFLEGIGFPKLSVIWIMPSIILVQGMAQVAVARRY